MTNKKRDKDIMGLRTEVEKQTYTKFGDQENLNQAYSENIKKQFEKQQKCKHEFTHTAQSGFWGCETVIYCKKCGLSRSIK